MDLDSATGEKGNGTSRKEKNTTGVLSNIEISS